MNSIIKLAVFTTLAMGLLVAAVPMLHADNAAPMATGQAAPNRQNWRKHHPWRAKDNARIRNQRRMLNQDLKAGKITKEQYDAQMKDLNTIKREERADAQANENGGHLSAGQQQAINQQLNENRKDINQDANKNAAGNAAPAAPAQGQ